jgi:peroxiredoxin
MNEVPKKFWPLLTLALTLSLGSLAQRHERKSFTLEVSIRNPARPATLILTLRDGNQWTEFKSESTNGKFFISGSLDEPSFAYLVLKYNHELGKAPQSGNTRELFIDPGKIILQPSDSIRHTRVSGGESETALELLNQSLSANSKKESRQVIIATFIKNHPDSFVSLYALQNLSGPGTFIIDPNTVSPLFEQLSQSLRKTASCQLLDAEIQLARATALGSIAPEFVQSDTLDRAIALHSFRGNYVFIDFWASWCGPCRKENPALVYVYNQFSKSNFKIVGVSLDKSRKAWTSAIRKDKLSWTNVSDLKYWRNEVALRYGVKTIPQNFLLNPDGRIVARNISAEILATTLEKFFAEKK